MSSVENIVPKSCYWLGRGAIQFYCYWCVVIVLWLLWGIVKESSGWYWQCWLAPIPLRLFVWSHVAWLSHSVSFESSNFRVWLTGVNIIPAATKCEIKNNVHKWVFALIIVDSRYLNEWRVNPTKISVQVINVILKASSLWLAWRKWRCKRVGNGNYADCIKKSPNRQHRHWRCGKMKRGREK